MNVIASRLRRAAQLDVEGWQVADRRKRYDITDLDGLIAYSRSLACLFDPP
jgi:hypothetical protein